MEIILEYIKNGGISDYGIFMLIHKFHLLTSIPIVITIVGFCRHFIGVNVFNTNVVLILTYTFYELGYNDVLNYSDQWDALKYGSILFLTVFVVSVLLYSFVKNFDIHIIPKQTLVMVGVSISVIIIMILGVVVFKKEGFVNIDFLTIILMAILSNTFVLSAGKKNIVKVSIITFLVSYASYLLISSDFLKFLLDNYYLIILLLLIVFNFFIGRYTGFRLTEYWRFRSLLTIDYSEDYAKKVKSDNRK